MSQKYLKDLNFPLGEALKNNKVKSKKYKIDKINKTKGIKQTHYINIWFIINSIVFQNLKIAIILKKCHMILCIKD